MAWTSRSSWFGSPPDARLSAATASSTAEKIIDCMTSVAALGITTPTLACGLAPGRSLSPRGNEPTQQRAAWHPLRAPAVVSSPVRGPRAARDALSADPAERPQLRPREPRRACAADPEPRRAVELPARARAPDLLRRGAARPLAALRSNGVERPQGARDRLVEGAAALDHFVPRPRDPGHSRRSP